MEFTAKEAAIYDRQLRLWGVEAQKRMQNSRVLISGITALGSELAKNLVLAGINVTLQDSTSTALQDVQCQFLLHEKDIGVNRATACLPKIQDLNPLVQVNDETKALEDLDETYLSQFNIICLMNASKASQLRINSICREKKIAFYSAQTFGMDGIMFADLGQHVYRRTPVGEQTAAAEPITMNFPSFKDLGRVKWSDLHSQKRRGLKLPRVFVYWQVLLEFQDRNGRFPQVKDAQDVLDLTLELCEKNDIPQDFCDPNDCRSLATRATMDMAPVCAIMGGMIGQELVKAISQKDEPICNIFYFDSVTGNGTMRCIGL